MTDTNRPSKTVSRYTQPVIQVQPGPEFRTAEVPLFEDPKGKWVKYEDIQHLLPPGETQSAECGRVRSEEPRRVHEG